MGSKVEDSSFDRASSSHYVLEDSEPGAFKVGSRVSTPAHSRTSSAMRRDEDVVFVQEDGLGLRVQPSQKRLTATPPSGSEDHKKVMSSSDEDDGRVVFGQNRDGSRPSTRGMNRPTGPSRSSSAAGRDSRGNSAQSRSSGIRKEFSAGDTTPRQDSAANRDVHDVEGGYAIRTFSRPGTQQGSRTNSRARSAVHPSSGSGGGSDLDHDDALKSWAPTANARSGAPIRSAPIRRVQQSAPSVRPPLPGRAVTSATSDKAKSTRQVTTAGAQRDRKVPAGEQAKIKIAETKKRPSTTPHKVKFQSGKDEKVPDLSQLQNKQKGTTPRGVHAEKSGHKHALTGSTGLTSVHSETSGTIRDLNKIHPKLRSSPLSGSARPFTSHTRTVSGGHHVVVHVRGHAHAHAHKQTDEKSSHISPDGRPVTGQGSRLPAKPDWNPSTLDTLFTPRKPMRDESKDANSNVRKDPSPGKGRDKKHDKDHHIPPHSDHYKHKDAENAAHKPEEMHPEAEAKGAVSDNERQHDSVARKPNNEEVGSGQDGAYTEEEEQGAPAGLIPAAYVDLERPQSRRGDPTGDLMPGAEYERPITRGKAGRKPPRSEETHTGMKPPAMIIAEEFEPTGGGADYEKLRKEIAYDYDEDFESDEPDAPHQAEGDVNIFVLDDDAGSEGGEAVYGEDWNVESPTGLEGVFEEEPVEPESNIWDQKMALDAQEAEMGGWEGGDEQVEEAPQRDYDADRREMLAKHTIHVKHHEHERREFSRGSSAGLPPRPGTRGKGDDSRGTSAQHRKEELEQRPGGALGLPPWDDGHREVIGERPGTQGRDGGLPSRPGTRGKQENVPMRPGTRGKKDEAAAAPPSTWGFSGGGEREVFSGSASGDGIPQRPGTRGKKDEGHGDDRAVFQRPSSHKGEGGLPVRPGTRGRAERGNSGRPGTRGYSNELSPRVDATPRTKGGQGDVQPRSPDAYLAGEQGEDVLIVADGGGGQAEILVFDDED